MAGKSWKTVGPSILAGVCFLVAIIVLACTYRTAHEAPELKEFWNAFVAAIVINAIGSVYFFVVPCIPDGSLLWKTIVLFDVTMGMLVIAWIGAGWQTYSQMVGGCTTCDQFHDFCGMFLTAMIFSSVGFCVSFVLLVHILHVSVDPFLIDN